MICRKCGRTDLIDSDFNFQFVLKEEYREKLVESKQRCLRTREWKLVCTPTIEGTRHFGLFRLSADPNCIKDVAGDHPEVLARMRRALERWIDEKVETPLEEEFPESEGG